jgi:hypothetical protein
VGKLTFEEWYLEKKDEGLKDEDISRHLNVSIGTLKKMKKAHDIAEPEKLKTIRSNNYGFTQEQLKIADENGISRRIALRRYRELHWSREDAITIPRGMRRAHYGKTKHQRQLERSEYNSGLYQERKWGLRR